MTLAVLCGAATGPAWAVSVDDFLARMYSGPQGTLPYRLFVPDGYTPAQKYPLVLFLHGLGENGNDNRNQLEGQTGPLVFAAPANQAVYPSFMLAPQCPQGSAWTDTSMRLRVAGIIDGLRNEFSLDTNRYYITGLSLGGYGTWDYLSQYPDMYAAAIPMSGGGPGGLASRMKKIAIWNFHAADDGAVSVDNSRSMVTAVRRAGGSVVYTEYATGGHVIWTEAYATPVLMDWVYAQRRGAASVTEPLLALGTPSSDPTWYTGATNVDLAGTASALGQTIKSVSWFNYANNARGTAVGIGAWSVAKVPLVANKTNVVVVTATTTSWVPAYGGNTTFNGALAVVQSPLKEKMALQGGQTILQWTGGGPPFRVLRSGDPTGLDWTEIANPATSPLVLDTGVGLGFYRVVGR